ncbi:hypothetical protein [Paraburkholderia sp. ZP32-5]|uniref:TubC N-terminal docking domain-related protein n=1 Tax=Paraburkholderia sp. ZP32-5 TaxID=2883245 RepID=UPI001F30F588|nr:hypothetical protein [Paraburkholderia sp. ZP32-5]
MSAVEIVSKAKAMGVRLLLNGDGIKMRGPADAIATIKPVLAAHKPEVIAYLRTVEHEAAPADCSGALLAPDGGLYLPWGPYLSPDDVRRMRAELAELIEDLADSEGWPADHRNDVLSRAMRGPLADLLPNLAYFRERSRGPTP